VRSLDSIQVLLRVRFQREQLEERKLAAIIEKLKLAQSELGHLSNELNRITTTRLNEIQCAVPNTHHQAVEAHTKLLWKQCVDYVEEIKRLKGAYTQQLSTYLFAHREREIMESFDKRRNEARQAERNLREQKLNEDLFLARRVAKWDT
jgi:flagellar export protein FliJ